MLVVWRAPHDCGRILVRVGLIPSTIRSGRLMVERLHPATALPETSDSDAPFVVSLAPLRHGKTGSRVRLLVSACLLGEKVRYDGQHKYDAYLVETLGRYVDWERVCPEADCGLPVPRPSMHLLGDPRAPRLVSRTGEDLTERMRRFTEKRLREIESIELCGYVCKKDSPSSGMGRVKIYDERGMAARSGAGLFTAAFMERYPLVPVEEEGRLHDLELSESFIERVFCRRRWLDLVRDGRRRGRLVQFHADHKFLLLAHGRRGYETLGRLVASAKDQSADELFAAYERGFVAALRQRASKKKTIDVLLHMLGFFKKSLSRDEKAELLETIEAYRRSLSPLIAPLTLIKHYVRKYDVRYLARQVFLSPYPAELTLRAGV
jgi:uncharacterized protein YbgA (DUF1722 family)/uncharacterized protein YbbK (DUF523 family)